ncbi:germinal-center associated nuclear protein isoform X2 [Hippoglossus hippoglossus]|uniref:germinal-center associated nuclear protein isoform X2 n=1 Tax=Hippoglossus hippoglossus TaxID=8267 RepID=UPI00148DF828|nr:germinal-center associated nuclear protein isoform X2 [Hippoglossus hippoglossus]
MNPSNPFGSPQGGAFQAPSNTMKTGLFQPFGQQSSNNQPQTMGFFPPSAFGQPAVSNQAPPHGNTMFGQAPAFGQMSTQPSSLPTITQAPAFGQMSTQPSSMNTISQVQGFGQTSAQPSSLNTIRQAPAFGQMSTQPSSLPTRTQAPVFGQMSTQASSLPTRTQAPAFGQMSTQPSSLPTRTQAPVFGQMSTQPSSLPTRTQAPAFGQMSTQPSSLPTRTQAPAFGQMSTQPSSLPTRTQAPAFGQMSTQPSSLPTRTQAPAFGQMSTQPSSLPTRTQAPAFGQMSTQSSSLPTRTQAPVFGQMSTQPSSLPTRTQPPAFGQMSAQPSSLPTITQAPAFGLMSAQPSSLPTITQAPAFGLMSAQPSSLPTVSQAPVFGQTSAQPSSLPTVSQAPVFGQTSAQPSSLPTVGQPPVFGQTSAQPSSLPTVGQPPVFGQTSAQPSSLPTVGQPPVFGQTSAQPSSLPTASQAPAFGQTSGPNQSSVFGQTSAFGQAAGFSQQAPGFDQQPPGFGKSQMASGSTTALGQPQPLAFGQSAYVQPSSTSVPTTVFGTDQSVTQSVTQSKSFGPSEFSFKPANEALFKPIFSASPEPANPQTTSLSSSPFGSNGNQTSTTTTTTSSTTTGFSQLTSAKSGPLGFSFSQPAAAPSVTAQNNPLTTSNSSGSTNTLQFTFSQPAPPSSSSTTQASTTQPTTPSSFSFSVKPPQPQTTPVFSGFGQSPAFGDTKGQAETSTDEKKNNLEALGETNIFARLGKGTKRKEDPVVPSRGPEKPDAEEDVSEESDSPRHPSKRPLMRSRGPMGGLFGRALSSLRKESPNTVRREATKETPQQALKWEETEKEDVQGQGDSLAATQPAVPDLTRDVLDKAEESDSAKAADPQLETVTPAKRGVRRESSESLGGMSPTDCTSLQCRNIPPSLNKKDIIEKHFGRYGKVSKVFCKTAKNLAFVHFEDHASAAKAKKKGKSLHRHELFLLWHRKKQSPGEKGSRPAAGSEEAQGESQEDTESRAASSTTRRPPLRAPAVSSSLNFSRSSPVRKSTLAKSLQFDAEPQKESSIESQSPVPSSLLHLIDQVAENAEEKYRLLEQRDKILRQGRPKRTDLYLSKVFVGTCPDMCPEKERYMRETRNQLSIFEVVQGTEMVYHAAAIKEYSRSSADQEEPLPHDLRPLPVLSMTMDYLVTQIMDHGDDNYRDWYDFVWNRTRGIRKDIIQQHLCCPHTVSLIENCTRFHVHCAHHLCEEHMSSFDAKINNENMTKCLQSLKEMYQDLAMRQIYCPCEAEFRQYNVLLKLDDGDSLREVQQFRDDVRNSPEVKFAVQAFAAVSNNNFVRFFKLVKGASYLASCLLHRYFNQVRAKALKTLNIAHTVGPRSTAFPLEDITRMFMFLDTAETIDFIQQYGLNVSDGIVELSRTAFQEPELPLSQKKSVCILAKKTVLIGEVVNGGSLPSAPQHNPVSSFDSQNKFRGEAPLAEPSSSQFRAFAAKLEVKAPPSVEPVSQVASRPDTPSEFVLPPAATNVLSESLFGLAHPADAQQLFQPIPEPQPIKAPSPPAVPRPVYSNEEIMAELDGVIEEVVEAATREVAVMGASYASTALAESSVQVESLVSEVLGQLLQEVSSTEIKEEQERVAEEKRKLEEARRRQEHKAFLAQFSCSICTEILHEVLDETIKETSTSEIQLAVNEKADRVAKCTEQVCTSLVEETLNADIALMVEEILDAELQRIHKYIKRWRDVVTFRRQLKRQMRGFPAAPCCVDPRFKLKALAPSAPARPCMEDLARGLVNLGNAGTLAMSSTRLFRMRQEAIHQMRVHYYYQQLLDEMVWAPLDLPALVSENIPDPPERIYWKIALLLPSNHESVASLADRILSDWLEVKLGGDKASEVGEEQPDGTLQTLCVTNSLQERGQHTHKVHISVKASRGPLTEDSLSKMEESCELCGTGALIMLLPAMPAVESGQDEQDVPLLSALLQLKQLQQTSTWHCPLPLVILVPGPDGGAGDTEKLVEALRLQMMVMEGLISEFTFFFIPETTSDVQGSKQLSHALRWLLGRAPPSLPLSCQTLVQLVESSLSREFTPRVYGHRQERGTACLPSQDPAPIIQLYNAVLAHIADTASSQDLCKLSWPPGEFCLPETRDFVPHLGWNSAEHLAWLREAILSLQLPQWEQLSSTDSWCELCSSIYCYAAQIPVSYHSQPLLMSRLENLLERVRLKGHRTRANRSEAAMGSWGTGDEGVLTGYSQIPWDDVLVICIDHKLKDWQIPGPPACEDAVTEDGEILIYFLTESLKGFQPPEEWTQATRQTHREKQQRQQQEEERGASAAACASPTSLALRQRLFHSTAEPLEAAAASLDITHTPTTQELLAHKVLQSLEEEKVESKRGLEQLQRWLDGDPLEHLSSPLFIPSSTLLCRPTTMIYSPTAKTRDATLTQEPDDVLEKSTWPKTIPVSMAWRLKELERQILASQEEELACRLKLSGLLSIVDD